MYCTLREVMVYLNTKFINKTIILLLLMFKNTQKEYLEYLETQMNDYKLFDYDMYIHYRNKLRKELNTK